MLKKALLVSLLVLSPLKAGDPWTKSEVALEATYQTLLFIDWKQTSEFHRFVIINSDGSSYQVHERNAFLGSDPKQATINAFCILSSIGHFILSHTMKNRDRKLWQIATIGIEVLAVNGNYNAKIRIRW
jgi:hypothetical protein